MLNIACLVDKFRSHRHDKTADVVDNTNGQMKVEENSEEYNCQLAGHVARMEARKWRKKITR